MSEQSKKLAGILLIILPTVAFGGTSLLSLLINDASGYADNALRQDLWRAGHAHAGVLLILSLVILRYVDEAKLSEQWKTFEEMVRPCLQFSFPLHFLLQYLILQQRSRMR